MARERPDIASAGHIAHPYKLSAKIAPPKQNARPCVTYTGGVSGPAGDSCR